MSRLTAKFIPELTTGRPAADGVPEVTADSVPEPTTDSPGGLPVESPGADLGNTPGTSPVYPEAPLEGEDPSQVGNAASDRDQFQMGPVAQMVLSVVVFGASGDLAKKKTYPALFALFDKGFLPSRVQILGYARTGMTDEVFRQRLRPFLLKAAAASAAPDSGDGPERVAAVKRRLESSVDKFLGICAYHKGQYEEHEGYISLQRRLLDWERRMAEEWVAAGGGGGGGSGVVVTATAASPSGGDGDSKHIQRYHSRNSRHPALHRCPSTADAASSSASTPRLGRLMYLALPATVYPQVCTRMRAHVATFCEEKEPLTSSTKGKDSTSVVSDGPAGHVASPAIEIEAKETQTPSGDSQGADADGAGAVAPCASGFRPHPSSWVRVVLEKPFGHDLASSEALAAALGREWPEDQLYRIDHYLGKELVQNMLVLRFANGVFGGWWSRHHISNIQITFKEDFGTEGRGGYFDQYGIIRDVIQNHLMQVLALLTMEAPVSLHPDDIRDEKVKALRCLRVVTPKDCLLGQYEAANGHEGYLDDPTVSPDSRTPTFAAVRLFMRNERWEGVPIIVKAGKALNERLAVVRIQLKTPSASIFGNLEEMRNELVIRFQPYEAIYAKVVVKRPGLDMDLEMSELDLTYPERYKGVVIPDAYERLILDCIRGDQQHFVRRDELRAAWAVFSPLLQAIDDGEVPLEKYAYGSRGPASLNDFVAASGFVKSERYEWKPRGESVGGAASPNR